MPMIFNQEWFYFPGHIWPGLETFLLVMTGRPLLASSGWAGGQSMLLRTLQCIGQPPQWRIVWPKMSTVPFFLYSCCLHSLLKIVTVCVSQFNFLLYQGLNIYETINEAYREGLEPDKQGCINRGCLLFLQSSFFSPSPDQETINTGKFENHFEENKIPKRKEKETQSV